ncbi:MAG: PAS domain-containing protein [Alphaproteobacteria bacterium]|nr:MAG: PAS domain-containing protein [Alphaproteobacteria bacterium]
MTDLPELLARIQTPVLIDLINYWGVIRKNRPIPLRQHFNPVDIPQCLRHIILIDVLDERPRYYIRLAGSVVNPAFPHAANGQFIENVLHEEDRQEVLAQYERSVKQAAPTYKKSTVKVPSGRRLAYERIILPMSGDGEKVDKLITGINFFDVRPGVMDRPILKI